MADQSVISLTHDYYRHFGTGTSTTICTTYKGTNYKGTNSHVTLFFIFFFIQKPVLRIHCIGLF